MQAHRDSRAEGVHQAADRAALLRHRDEELARTAVVVEAHGDVALVAAHVELVGHAAAGVGEPFAPRRCRHLGRGLVGLGARIEGLALLRPVTIDGQRLEAEPPALHVGTGDVGRRRLAGHVHGLGDGARDEGLRRSHHLHVRLPGDAPLAEPRLERTVEDRQVLVLEARGAFDRVVLVDVGEHRFDRWLVVAERAERERHRLVDDLEHAAAGELLVFHQRDVGLDAGGVAIHQERDRAGGREHRRLGVAVAVAAAAGEHVVPDLPGGVVQILRARAIDLLDRIAVHLHDVEHRLTVAREALEGPDGRGELGARSVGGAMEDRRDRAAEAPAGVAVVGEAVGHEQAAEVRVAEAERPEEVAILRDPLRRVAGVIDEDLLGDEEDSAGRRESLHVEVAVWLAELHQVDAGEVAGRVVQEHVLGARIRGVDPARIRAGVPAVDRGVVLHAGIAALPGALGHAAHHFAGLEARAGLRGIGHPTRGPGVVAVGGLHEVVGEADGEIRVLEEDRAVGLAVEVGVVASLLDEDAGLLFLLRLALDEFHDVGVRDFERLHLGGAAGLATALHHRGHLVIDPHEGERAGGLAAAGELLPLAAERGEVGAGARAKLEEHRLAPRELHDVFHVVLHALDEAGAPLRIFVGVVGHHDVALRLVPAPVAGGALHAVLVEEADVEPDRRVEGAVLVHAEPGQVAVEVFAVLLRLEVAVGDAPVGDRAGDAVDELLDGVLALGRVDLAVEILAHHHVGGQLAPGGRNLTGRLLEEHLAVFPLDRRRPQLPFGGVERAVHVHRAERRLHLERLAGGGRLSAGGRGARRCGGESRGRFERCHDEVLLARESVERKSILPYSVPATDIERAAGVA